MGITETWLRESSVESNNIDGYRFISKCRDNRAGGGVGLYISNDLNTIVRSDLNFDDNSNTDALFIEINRNQECSVIVGVVYRAPDQN